MVNKLYSEVALTQNIAEYNLKIGDIATLLDFIPHPQGAVKPSISGIVKSISTAAISEPCLP
jgi:hypothetical protein